MTTPPAAAGSVIAADIIEISLPLLRPYRSGTAAITQRRILLVRLAGDEFEGWGECAPVPGYSRETFEECRSWLHAEAIRLTNPAPSEPPLAPASAAFAVEAALAGMTAESAASPLWRHLGGTRERVEVGAVIGLTTAAADVAAEAESLAADGYRRIKLKMTPGEDRARVAEVRRALPDHELAVDANGTFDPSDPAAPAFLDEFGLSFIEQPFPAGAIAAHASLARAIATPVCLDESITSVESAIEALETEAASVINIKPARVGGLQAAVAIHDAAAERGAALWCGGMLESGIGKAAALAVASLPGMSLPADLPPSRRHYREDLIDPPWEMYDGAITLPSGAGSGVHPDRAEIERHTISVSRFGDDVGWRR
jgi:O-succinylbenzoate synthase